MRIGLIADTHMPFRGTTLWNEVDEAFEGVDLVIHAGDIVHPSVLDRIEQIAPVLAARGNNDVGIVDHRIRDLQWLDRDGKSLVAVHDTEPESQAIADVERIYLGGRHADVIVTGHTHFERLDFRDGVLQINPGSATLPHLQSYRLGTVGILEWGPAGLDVRIQRLGHSPGLANPGIEYRFSAATGVLRLG